MVIEITDFAKKRMNELLAKSETETYFNLYIAGRNWRGPTFGLVLAEPKANYFKMDAEGYQFAMEDGIQDLYRKFAIDFIQDTFRSGFVARGEKV